MAGLLDALKIIREQLPQFLSQTNVPFSRDQPSVASVMTGKTDPGLDEKRVLEMLLQGAAAVIPAAKGAGIALRNPVATGAALTAATGDPTNLINNPVLQALTYSGDAEAMMVGAGSKSPATQKLLALGKTMLGQGESAATTFKASHSFVSPGDKIVKTEISDAPATLLRDITGSNGQWRLDKVLEHPELFENYPDLRKILVSGNPSSHGARYNGLNEYLKSEDMTIGTAAGGGVDNILKSILHETQHAIQAAHRENWAKGTSTAGELQRLGAGTDMDKYLKLVEEGSAYNNLVRELPREVRGGLRIKGLQTTDLSLEETFDNLYDSNLAPELKDKLIKKLTEVEQAQFDAQPMSAEQLRKTAEQNYKRSAGEAEARAVEARMYLPDSERFSTVPTESYDILDLITRFK